jgi:acyl-coenzyme A thioesterase PaaI-like protein
MRVTEHNEAGSPGNQGIRIIQNIEPIIRTGLVFEAVEPNKLVGRMPLAGNSNHTGIMYAGSLFALAECMAGVLFINRFGTEKIAPICANIDIRFRRPASSDVTLTMVIEDDEFERLEHQVMEQGKASVTYEEHLVDANGEVVSIADVKFVLLKI